jgi:hypothetical protein
MQNKETAGRIAKHWGRAQGMWYESGAGKLGQGVYLSGPDGPYRIEGDWLQLYNERRSAISLWLRRVFAGKYDARLYAHLLQAEPWRDRPGAQVCTAFSPYSVQLRALIGLRTPRHGSDLGVIGAMLGEPVLRRAERNSQARFAWQPGRLAESADAWVAYGDLSWPVMAYRTALLQWKLDGDAASLVNVWSYTDGLHFGPVRAGSPVGTVRTDDLKRTRAVLDKVVGYAEPFVFNLPGRSSELWPAQLPELAGLAMPPAVAAAVRGSSAVLVDSGFSVPFCVSHNQAEEAEGGL